MTIRYISIKHIRFTSDQTNDMELIEASSGLKIWNIKNLTGLNLHVSGNRIITNALCVRFPRGTLVNVVKRGKAGKTTSVQSEGATSSGSSNAVTEHKTKEYTIAAPWRKLPYDFKF
jgi:hypothetical protein